MDSSFDAIDLVTAGQSETMTDWIALQYLCDLFRVIKRGARGKGRKLPQSLEVFWASLSY